jgi:hypothetical protein
VRQHEIQKTKPEEVQRRELAYNMQAAKLNEEN